MVLFLGKLPMKNWQKALAACCLVACMLCIPRLLPKSEIGDVARMEGNIQVVESTLSSGSYADIRVTAGIPVRWITHADEDEINGCNNRMLCRDLGLELTFTPGENLLEFTADTPGVYAYSCWMGSTWRFWRPRMPTARCAPPSIPGQVCNGSRKAYFVEQGDKVACQNCGNAFGREDVGVLSGGCNPYPIFAEDREDSEEAVRISYDFLSGAESLFTRWKENGK